MHNRTILQTIIMQVLIPVYLLAAIPSYASNDNLFTAAGAHSSWVLMNKIKPALEKISGSKIDLFGKQSMLGVGCNAGIKSVLRSTHKQESFGLVCCPLSDAEIAEKNLVVFPLALEPIMILSHESNPVSSLSIKQIKAVFSGKIINWEQVGGENKAIVVVTRLHCKKRPGHWKAILDSPDKFSTKRINVQSADEMVKRVGDFKAAFGHAGSAWLRGDNSKTKIIRVNGFLPTRKNLKEGNYPFYRKLSIITNKEASKKLKDLMLSAQMQVFSHPELFDEYQLLPLDPRAH